VQAAVAVMHTVHQPPVQWVTQRIETAAGKSCLAFWDTGSQVMLTTHKAAKEMRLEPIPGPPLNLMGVGDSQKTSLQCGTKSRWSTPGGGRWRMLPMA
jgi:hypothetical protein